MKVRTISALTTLLLAVALCVFSSLRITPVLDTVTDYANEARTAVEHGDPDTALETMRRMSNVWANNRDLLEVLTPHEDLHDATSYMSQATRSLECGDLDDFYITLSILDQQIGHLREHERLSLSNIL